MADCKHGRKLTMCPICCESLVEALEQIAAMDPKGIRADDLGRAARIASEAIRASVGALQQRGADVDK